MKIPEKPHLNSYEAALTDEQRAAFRALLLSGITLAYARQKAPPWPGGPEQGKQPSIASLGVKRCEIARFFALNALALKPFADSRNFLPASVIHCFGRLGFYGYPVNFTGEWGMGGRQTTQNTQKFGRLCILRILRLDHWVWPPTGSRAWSRPVKPVFRLV